MAVTTVNNVGCKMYGGVSWYSANNGEVFAGATADNVKYKAVFYFPAINTLSSIKSIKFYMKRGDGYADRTLYIGTNSTRDSSAATTLGTISFNNQTSTFQEYDLTAYKANLTSFTAQWYFYLWHTTTGTYCEIKDTAYMVVETEDGTMYVGVDGQWIKCQVYFGDSGAWKKVIPYFGNAGTWTKIGG